MHKGEGEEEEEVVVVVEVVHIARWALKRAHAQTTVSAQRIVVIVL